MEHLTVLVPVSRITHLPVGLLLDMGFAFFEGDDLIFDLSEIDRRRDHLDCVEVPASGVFSEDEDGAYRI